MLLLIATLSKQKFPKGKHNFHAQLFFSLTQNETITGKKNAINLQVNLSAHYKSGC